MPAIEGVNPQDLWTFFYVLIAIFGVIIIVDKVGDIVKKHRKNAEMPCEEKAREMGEKIERVEERVNKHSEEIETINDRLSDDNRRLNNLESKHVDISEAISVLCKGQLCMIEHALHNGNAEQMSQARDELLNYLSRV